ISNLKEARLGLLRLHKALLENEKENYESRRGKIQTTGEYYNLVVNDAQFAWLRQMSGVIVEIDEALDAKKEPLTEEMVIELAGQIRRLLVIDDASDYGKKYDAALQTSPDAMFEHLVTLKMLSKFNNEV
ncbi:MAG: hypothetical protein ABI954_10610, partial [Pyrinomonadaceae bacterium]